jgi:NADH dehydrogenase
MITRQLLDKNKATAILLGDKSTVAEVEATGLDTPAESLIAAGAKPVYSDLQDPSALEKACRGVETIIRADDSVLHGGRKPIENVDLQDNRRLLDAAEAAGVQHFILVSVFGATAGSANPLARAMAIYEEECQQSGLTYTILQPGPLLDVWVAAVVRAPLQTGRPLTLVEPGDHRHAFVAARDVAAYTVLAVDHGAARNAILRIGGPAAYSWQDIVSSAAEVVGQPLAVNYLDAGEPVPLLHKSLGPLLVDMETFASYINMNAAVMVFKIRPTPLNIFMQEFLAPVTTA